ncbi:MAG: hypothetical protein WC889_10895 [Myxococcota bacterium]|jgi:hypothetical protein
MKLKRSQVPFAYKLVLNQCLLSQFNVKRFEDLAEHLRNEKLEGLDENNIHHFHHALTAQLFNLTKLTTDLLLEYDQNIVKYTQRLNERRITRGEEPMDMIRRVLKDLKVAGEIKCSGLGPGAIWQKEGSTSKRG